jgi:hypothetical protein
VVVVVVVVAAGRRGGGGVGGGDGMTAWQPPPGCAFGRHAAVFLPFAPAMKLDVVWCHWGVIEGPRWTSGGKFCIQKSASAHSAEAAAGRLGGRLGLTPSAVRLPPVRWLAASGRPLHDPFDARSGRCGAFSCAADVNVGVGRVISRDYSMLNHVLNLIGCGVNPEAHC